MKLWLKFERAVHRIDAYLARNRGDLKAYLFSKNKENECSRLLDTLRIQQ